MMVDKDFLNHIEMNKLAIGALVGPALIGGLTVMDVAGETQRRKGMVQLNRSTKPAGVSGQINQYKLGGPQNYQFEGGKHTNLKTVQTPHSSIY